LQWLTVLHLWVKRILDPESSLLGLRQLRREGQFSPVHMQIKLINIGLFPQKFFEYRCIKKFCQVSVSRLEGGSFDRIAFSWQHGGDCCAGFMVLLSQQSKWYNVRGQLEENKFFC
jgi:hypothetical protein